tara:strand:+ start:1186 stop:1599 length:414 start_codon:yes stop_codon:yes gene_type:complete
VAARWVHIPKVGGSNPPCAPKIINMKNTDFDILANKLADLAKDTMKKKGPEYTNEHTDVLNNFKATGKRLNISPIKVWSIFMDKQIQSVMAHVNNPNLDKAESIDSRFADIINYCYLGNALFNERDSGAIKEVFNND